MIEGFIWLLKQSWFAVSPSPWSLAFYAVMALIGSQILLNLGAKYRRAQRLMAFLDALFLLGIIVFIQDSIWLIFNTWRWILPLYSGTATFLNYYVRFPQNIMGAALMILLTWGVWKSNLVAFRKKTIFWFAVISAFTFTVFLLAPGQQLTDWTYAISHGYSDQIILQAFLISHIGYKLLIALAFLSLFPKKQT